MKHKLMIITGGVIAVLLLATFIAPHLKLSVNVIRNCFIQQKKNGVKKQLQILQRPAKVF